MKKSKRKFLIGSLFVITVAVGNVFNITNGFIQKKIIIYKKKYSKVWLLDINDS